MINEVQKHLFNKVHCESIDSGNLKTIMKIQNRIQAQILKSVYEVVWQIRMEI
jgi:hypothetical protein